MILRISYTFLSNNKLPFFLREIFVACAFDIEIYQLPNEQTLYNLLLQLQTVYKSTVTRRE